MDIVKAIISTIIANQLIHWCLDGSQKNNVFTRLWSNATHLLGGKEIRDEMLWENLPLELCGEIGKRLASRLDILRFRSVCKKWRSSLPSPTSFPLWVPPLPNCEPERLNVSYLITEVNIYSVRSSGHLFVSFEEVDQGGKFHARFLFPKELEFNYPTLSFMPSGHPLSQLTLVSKAYHLRMALHRSDSQARGVKGQWDFQNNALAKKTVLISSNADSVNPSYTRASDLSVVAHMSLGKMKGRLALLRLGGSPENWVWETDFCSSVFEDIATYKGQLCVLDSSGKVFLMDYNSLHMTQVCDSSSIAHDLEDNHLCEACGDLYLTKKTTGGIEAYKLSLRLQKWLKVEDMANPLSALLPFFV